MFTKILQTIEKYDKIIIHRHSSPDGDALGSQIGLKVALQENYPNKEVFVVGDDAKRYSFMDGSKMDEIPDEVYSGGLAIILDCGAASLISDNRYKLAAQTIRFDHHIFGEKIADLEQEKADPVKEEICHLRDKCFELEEKLLKIQEELNSKK